MTINKVLLSLIGLLITVVGSIALITTISNNQQNVENAVIAEAEKMEVAAQQQDLTDICMNTDTNEYAFLTVNVSPYGVIYTTYVNKKGELVTYGIYKHEVYDYYAEPMNLCRWVQPE